MKLLRYFALPRNSHGSKFLGFLLLWQAKMLILLIESPVRV